MAKSSLPRATSRSKRRGRHQGEPRTIEREQVIWAPPVGMPVAGGPVPEAVGLFERAMASLQRHQYRVALRQFDALQAEFPGEGALLDRARVYAALCRRRGLGRTVDGAPKTVEERLTAATAALNNGDDRRAEQLVAQVLDEVPGHDLGHYLLAVVHARRGATAAALDALRRAIATTPEVRVQARHDADFAALRGSNAFERLVTDTPARSGTRRGA